MAFPDLKFAEDDARVLSAKLKDVYEAIRRAAGEKTYKLALGDPERLVQETEAAALAQVNTDIDLTGKGNLLYFAGEDTIEHLGYFYGKRGDRLQMSSALTTIRYTLVKPLSAVTTIPKGYRTTADNAVFFATKETLEIPAGEMFGDVQAECMTPGFAGMGFGQ